MNTRLIELGPYNVVATEMNAGWTVRVDSSVQSTMIPLLLSDSEISRFEVAVRKIKVDQEPYHYAFLSIAGAMRVSMRAPF